MPVSAVDAEFRILATGMHVKLRNGQKKLAVQHKFAGGAMQLASSMMHCQTKRLQP